LLARVDASKSGVRAEKKKKAFLTFEECIVMKEKDTSREGSDAQQHKTATAQLTR